MDFPNDKLTSWRQFCNNLDCLDCGTWVDLSNDGCLVETNRQAINVKRNAPSDTFVALIVSSSSLIISSATACLDCIIPVVFSTYCCCQIGV